MIKHVDRNVSLEQLLLDPNNYRLADEKTERHIPDKEVERLQKDTLISLDKQRLGELKDSIRNNGFLEMERIVVRLLKTTEDVDEENKNQKYVVIEGNRRIAALKSLQKLGNNGNLNTGILNTFNSLNVMLIEGDEQQLKTFSATLMGIRHVSGPKKWDGFQSAKLINDLSTDGHSFSEIGDILGITSREVGRRFRGYQAFIQMQRDSSYKDKVEPRHYGLLLEFLSASKSGRNWLSWNDATYEFEDDTHLKRVYKAITTDLTGKLEIRNPADARKFLSLLDTQYQNDIEAGTDIHEMPDPSDFQKVGGKIKRIDSFIMFIDKHNFDAEENEKLEALLACLTNKVGNAQ